MSSQGVLGIGLAIIAILVAVLGLQQIPDGMTQLEKAVTLSGTIIGFVVSCVGAIGTIGVATSKGFDARFDDVKAPIGSTIVGAILMAASQLAAPV